MKTPLKSEPQSSNLMVFFIIRSSVYAAFQCHIFFCRLNLKQKKREIHKLNYLKQTFSNPMVYLYSFFKLENDGGIKIILVCGGNSFENMV